MIAANYPGKDCVRHYAAVGFQVLDLRSQEKSIDS